MIVENQMKIDNIFLKIIPDSKGKDTLEAQMSCGEVKVTASVPAGESTGKNEAKTIDPKKALEKISWINSQIKETEFATLEQFDGLLQTLDGTSDKSNLGANLIIALSIAFTKLLAKTGGMETWQLIEKLASHSSSGNSKKKMPLCFFNLIEGGVHSGDPSTSPPFQEHWFIPRTNSPKESLNQALIFIKALGEKIQTKYGKLQMGSEGGYVVPSKDPEEGLKILQEVIEEEQFDADLGLDCAASTFLNNGSYNLGGKIINSDELLSYYELLTKNYQLFAIEDPFAENDWESFSKITEKLGEKTWIIGDDLTTTNVGRIKEANQKKAINAVIIKPTQIGTVTETLQAANLAKKMGWKIIVSNRGEETADHFIADLAVGLSADAIKSGCPLQKERLVKYERLIKIEETWQN